MEERELLSCGGEKQSGLGQLFCFCRFGPWAVTGGNTVTCIVAGVH